MAVAINVSIERLAPTVEEHLRAAARGAVRAIRATVKGRGPQAAVEVINSTRPRPPVHTGAYRAFWKATDVPGGAMLFNPLKYAGVLDRGRRPGSMPPVDVLTRWVIRKGIAGGKEARSIAFAIAVKMKKQGWPFSPNQPMRITDRIAERLVPLVREAVDKFLRTGVL